MHGRCIIKEYVINVDVLLNQVRSALERGDLKSAVGLLEALKPADQANVFDDLQPEEQDKILPRLNPEDSADILEELQDEDAAQVAERLQTKNLADILDHMEPDEAADLLGDIEPALATKAIQSMKDADEVLPLLEHTDDSAGGLMTAADVILKKEMTVNDAIKHLRAISPDSEQIYYLFVVDDKGVLAGVVNLRDLVVAPKEALIGSIMERDVISVKANTDQEEAVRIVKRYDLLALPVVDDGNRLLGVITYDDSLDILEDEATEDIYRLGGISKEKPGDISLKDAVRSRLPWLIVNLVMAMVTGTVLSLFENTIAQMAALASFFPIVAGVSGSSGTQTLTVTVRSLATGEISVKDARRSIWKSLLLGLVNGLVLGALVILIAYLWKGDIRLGLIAGAATLINIIISSITGILIPLLIHKIKLDPALASPILVSTLADSLGYLVYLGLASTLLAFVL